MVTIDFPELSRTLLVRQKKRAALSVVHRWPQTGQAPSLHGFFRNCESRAVPSTRPNPSLFPQRLELVAR
jgi:hypothetical protein